jgi:hypothetical protein
MTLNQRVPRLACPFTIGHMLGMHLGFHDLAADYACRLAFFDRDLNLTWLIPDYCRYGYRQLDRFLGLHFLAFQRK